MIDWNRVAELKEEIGTEGFAEVVELFLAEVEQELDRLGDTCHADALEAKMHFLKGSALNLGLGDLSRLCQSGEAAAAKGDTGALDLGRIRACFTASRDSLLQNLK
ncbi:Hpt domain-containing protein [Roseovarius salis]|uniref:Hpt domain-containing protein n=1 Tax=Roseovarius salis TaxID=3376063 RepID=UPI0037CB0287